MSEWILKPGYVKPNTKNLPYGWVAKLLFEFCRFQQGGKLGLTKEHNYVSSGYPAYSAAGQDGYVQEAEFQDIDAVILSAIGANCGRCFYASGDWTTLANIQVIIPNDTVDAKYIFYRTNRGDYWTRSGSAQPFIKPSSIGKSWIAFPKNIKIQRKITTILNAIDQTIEKTEALIEKYQQIKAGLMYDLFTYGIGTDGKLRPPREQAPELYQETPIGWIPKEWSIKSCADLCLRICVGIVIQPTQYYVDDGVPAFRSANVRENGIDPTNLVYISPTSNNLLKKSQIKEGDILSVRTGYPTAIKLSIYGIISGFDYS